MHCISAIKSYGRLPLRWLERRLELGKRGQSRRGCLTRPPGKTLTNFTGCTVIPAAQFAKYKAPHPLSVSLSNVSSWKPSVNVAPCLTRPNYGSTPCAPRSRRSCRSTRPGPMVIRASSSDRVTRESSVRARVRAFPFDQYQFGSLRSCSFNSCCMPSSGSPRKRYVA